MRVRWAFFGSLSILLALLAPVVRGTMSATAATTTSVGAGTVASTTTIPPATGTASVAVVQATASAIAIGTVPTTHVALPVTFEERGGGVAKGLALRIEPLSNVNGAVPLRFEPADATLPVDLAPYDELSGTLVADLPYAGDYTSSLRLLYNGKIQGVYAVSVSRPAAAAAPAPTPLPLDPGELSDMIAEISPYKEQKVVATTTIAPSGAERVIVSQPVIRTLTKKFGDDSLGVENATLAVTDDNGKAVKFPLTMNPGDVQALRLILGGFHGAGRYDAKLRFQGLGHTFVEKTVAIRGRESVWVAFLCTLLGVALSFVLRNWYQKGRPRLVLERRAAALDSSIAEAAAQAPDDAVVREVAAAIRAQADRAWKNALVSEDWSNSAVLVLLERKTDLLLGWINARAAVSRTRPSSVAGAVSADMAGVEKFLRAPGITDETLKANEKTLSEIPGKLRAAAEKEIRTRIDALTAQLEAILKNRPLLKRRIDSDVRPILKHVTEKLDGSDFEGALAGIEEARKQYAIVLAQALRSDLGRPTPERVDPRVWSNLQERLRYPLETVEKAVSADEATQRFETALATYTRELAATLLISAKTELPAAQEEARKATLTTLIKLLDTVDTKIGTGKLMEAWNDVVVAHETLTDFDPRAASAMGDEAAPARAIAFSSGEELESGITVGTTSTLTRRPFGAVESELHWGDRVAALAAILIATAIGIGVLWNASLIWGGPADHVKAILWGLGAHQLSYTGLASVIEKFAK